LDIDREQQKIKPDGVGVKSLKQQAGAFFKLFSECGNLMMLMYSHIFDAVNILLIIYINLIHQGDRCGTTLPAALVPKYRTG